MKFLKYSNVQDEPPVPAATPSPQMKPSPSPVPAPTIPLDVPPALNLSATFKREPKKKGASPAMKAISQLIGRTPDTGQQEALAALNLAARSMDTVTRKGETRKTKSAKGRDSDLRVSLLNIKVQDANRELSRARYLSTQRGTDPETDPEVKVRTDTVAILESAISLEGAVGTKLQYEEGGKKDKSLKRDIKRFVKKADRMLPDGMEGVLYGGRSKSAPAGVSLRLDPIAEEPPAKRQKTRERRDSIIDLVDPPEAESAPEPAPSPLWKEYTEAELAELEQTSGVRERMEAGRRSLVRMPSPAAPDPSPRSPSRPRHIEFEGQFFSTQSRSRSPRRAIIHRRTPSPQPTVQDQIVEVTDAVQDLTEPVRRVVEVEADPGRLERLRAEQESVYIPMSQKRYGQPWQTTGLPLHADQNPPRPHHAPHAHAHRPLDRSLMYAVLGVEQHLTSIAYSLRNF